MVNYISTQTTLLPPIVFVFEARHFLLNWEFVSLNVMCPGVGGHIEPISMKLAELKLKNCAKIPHI